MMWFFKYLGVFILGGVFGYLTCVLMFIAREDPK